jgi:queuine tRNA-ribosyltransferase
MHWRNKKFSTQLGGLPFLSPRRKPLFRFELLHVDRNCGARLSRLTTPRGAVELPMFMPVGTCGTVKGITGDQLESIGSQAILANAYHLALRPGVDVIEKLGGLHAFMNWRRPILTDSGGFQIFSLARQARVDENGASFSSHIDGSRIELSPERSVEIQQILGSDMAMVLDHFVALPASAAETSEATERTVRWAKRCRDAHQRNDQLQFAIVQGGLDAEMRRSCARQLVDLDFPGYAIGGLSVGETPKQMYWTIDATIPQLPADCPRYLMGVGRPQDLLQSIYRGVDMFDCVMPTRNGRNAMAFTDHGPIKMRNFVHRLDPSPIEPSIQNPCSGFSRAYLRHLFIANEMLGPILLSIHNLSYYHQLLNEARESIAADCYTEFMERRLSGWEGREGWSAS